MAHVTLCRGRNMGSRFGQGILRNIATIVAGRTVTRGGRTRGASMIHRRRIERRGVGVAGVTLRCGWNMVTRLA